MFFNIYKYQAYGKALDNPKFKKHDDFKFEPWDHLDSLNECQRDALTV